MEETISEALETWNQADKESRECYGRLKLFWERRRAATATLQEVLQKDNVLLSYRSQNFRFVKSEVRKPLTMAAVKRGLKKCIEGDENIDAIIAVIQEERGRETRSSLCRMKNK